MKTIYLAGGCFWGTEQYMGAIAGVTGTQVGYANGHTKAPTYEDVCRGDTGHAETVEVHYDESKVSLPFLLTLYYDTINPFSTDGQGNDHGTQYRTGIYFVENEDKPLIETSLAALSDSLGKPVTIECLPLSYFYPAEEYHQRYLDKNPGGYCHISREKIEKAKKAVME